MFSLLKEQQVYKGYIRVWRRTIEFPNGKVIDWDVAGHDITNPCFAVTFPFDTKTKTTTLIKEYCQGLNELRYSLASGGFEKEKHKDILDAAKQELSEEAHLIDGRWISLLPENHSGIGEIKWGRNRFIPFICLDPIKDLSPKPRDPEEYIEIIENVKLEQVKRIIMNGEMMLPAVQTSFMAMEFIEKMKI